MNASQIEKAVIGCKGFGKLTWLRQLRVGTGYGDDGERTMDLWGIHIGKPWERVAVEIKISRADFLRDMRNPLKQRRARLVANQFYFAAPGGVLSASDLPIWAGLIEVGEHGAHVEVEAPWFDSAAPTWRFLAQVIRTVAFRNMSVNQTAEP